MAHYLIKAEINKELKDELIKKLRNNSFIKLQPFGKALTYSLQNARVQNDLLLWEEEDYCIPPLREEKETVLDKYFSSLSITKVNRGEGWEKINELPKAFPDL